MSAPPLEEVCGPAAVLESVRTCDNLEELLEAGNGGVAVEAHLDRRYRRDRDEIDGARVRWDEDESGLAAAGWQPSAIAVSASACAWRCIEFSFSSGITHPRLAAQADALLNFA